MMFISQLGGNRKLRLILLIVALPVLWSWKLWSYIWTAAASRGWDGTGHFAIAILYDQLIFPNTAGWTNAYFGGMPFPNFYPPLFYWSVALLHHTHLFSFSTAFKIVLSIPVVLMPAAICWLGLRGSAKSFRVGVGASLAALGMLFD